jgi:hypothetical protein
MLLTNIDHAIKPQQTRVCATLTLWLLLFLVKARVPEEAKNAQALFQSDTYINTTDLFEGSALVLGPKDGNVDLSRMIMGFPM